MGPDQLTSYMILQTDKIYLQILSEEIVSPDYAAWMNDYEITRFL
jgi:hypothetical protein